MGNNWLCKTITWKTTNYLNIKYLKVLFIITPPWKMKKEEQMPLPKRKPKTEEGPSISSHTLDSYNMCTTGPLRCSRRRLWSLREKLGGWSCYRLFFVTVGVWTQCWQRQHRPSKWTISVAESAGSSHRQPSHWLSELLTILPLNSIYASMDQKLFQLFSTKETTC